MNSVGFRSGTPIPQVAPADAYAIVQSRHRPGPICYAVLLIWGRSVSSAADLVSELIRAANRVPKLAPLERARIFERAAASIEDLYEQLVIWGTPIERRPGDMVRELRETSTIVDLFSDQEVAANLLEEATIMRVCLVLVEDRQELQGE